MLDDLIEENRREVVKGQRASQELELTDKLFSELRAHTLETIVLPSSIAVRDYLCCVVQVIDDLRERLMQQEVKGINAKATLETIVNRYHGS